MTGSRTVPGDEQDNVVAHISPSRIPSRAANAFQIFKMAEALSEMADRVVLFATGDNAETPPPDELRKTYGVERLPEIRLIPTRGRFGIHLFNLHAALKARRLSPALVISRSVGAAAFTARLGLPTIWECHAPPRRLERIYWRFLAGAKGFRRIVVISDALSAIMREKHPEIHDAMIVVAHDGVDTRRFEGLPEPATARRRTGRDPNRRIAAYAGHLYPGRGIELILDCAKALPHWTFLIAGGTTEDISRISDIVRQRNLDNVELLGFVDNAELPETLAAADILLMPYQQQVMVSGGALNTVHWMSPLKMFEYLAMGRAILSSDLPVLREVLDETVAILLEPDRVQDWIEGIQRMEAPDVRDPLAVRAREKARLYDWSKRAQRMTSGLLETS